MFALYRPFNILPPTDAYACGTLVNTWHLISRDWQTIFAHFLYSIRILLFIDFFIETMSGCFLFPVDHSGGHSALDGRETVRL